jgi:threonine aldolase
MALVETGLSTLIIELPHRELGGRLTPWEDVISIGELCKKNGVKYHCDGARIFEASAGYG